jgi:predicted ATPase
MLSAIEIQNFRGFAKLKLDNLGLVNLVVGRNNTGKTSLLEAISILANPLGPLSVSSNFRANTNSATDRFNPWFIRDGAENNRAQILGHDDLGEWGVVIQAPGGSAPLSKPVVQTQSLNDVQIAIIDRLPKITAQTVSVHDRSPANTAADFAEAVRPSEGESQMESLLRSVDGRIKTVRLDYTTGLQPFIVVDIGLSRRVPLSEVGQGVYRLVAIFSELLGQRPNICFIDEIENGIHYSVLPQVWKGIAEVAERFRIQVFATTHSGECLAAAHESFGSRKNYDLRVIQLYRTDGCIEGRVLNRELIQSGLDGNIDLR